MALKREVYKGHMFHGDSHRFEELADFIFNTYGRSIKYIADVAGGQGMLTRILNKKYNYESEVIDPREWVLLGVPCRTETFESSMAPFYDLIVGLHPDEATRSIAEAALVKPAILIPCCNFWDRSKTLGRDALLKEIGNFYVKNDVAFELVNFNFKTSKNIGLVSTPSKLNYIK